MIVIVAPGQGSQTPGFLEPWLAEPQCREQLDAISHSAGIDLAAHGTASDADTIRDTRVAQPLIVAAGLVTATAVLSGGRQEKISGMAGHSVGEVTAAALSGILSETDAIGFVRERGEAMADAAAREPSGMSAVLGGDESAVLELLRELDLYPANFNGGGQIVAAGSLPALATLSTNPLAGTRVIPLQVAGAFHTRFMQPAVARLKLHADDLEIRDPSIPIWTNRDGSRIHSGSDFVELMVNQVSSPVRWDRVMESFVSAGVTGIIELAPAGALVGLAKRGMKGIPTVAVRTPDDLPAAFAMIDGSSTP
ncbi:MAG: ACP S-malonyltransferase [Rhodoglobus sp.]